MPYTTPTLVQGLIDTDPTVDLTPFIASADSLIVNVCLPSYQAIMIDPNLSALMELIERWLSAHFYTILDNQLQMAKAGQGHVIFMQKIDYGLKCSMYGQQAMRLDYLGLLAALDNTTNIKRQINLGMFWMGVSRCYPGYLGDWSDITIEQ